jgi:hypothetical protein
MEQIDLDDLTAARQTADDFYLAWPESSSRRDGTLDGSVRLALDGPCDHPNLQSVFLGERDAFDSSSWMSPNG